MGNQRVYKGHKSLSQIVAKLTPRVDDRDTYVNIFQMASGVTTTPERVSSFEASVWDAFFIQYEPEPLPVYIIFVTKLA